MKWQGCKARHAPALRSQAVVYVTLCHFHKKIIAFHSIGHLHHTYSAVFAEMRHICCIAQ